MRALWSAALLVVSAASLAAQAPASHTYANKLGFSYSFPADWEVVDMSATLPEVKEQAQAHAGDDVEKRGAQCIQIALTARHGNPPSTVVALVLPFSCLGSKMADKDLSGMAAGAVEGLGANLDLGEPVTSQYALGKHTMWIERLTANLKGNPDARFTVETVCTLVDKGAVCWMAMAGDDAALGTFEKGHVKLDLEPARALVPADAFPRKSN